tara:strand:+ start:11385 stop:11975 length:591 start_codon:yes stop_codon:yes gene_type:complete
MACSGGVDSMAALDFLRRGGREIEVAYFNHNTPHSGYAQSFVQDYCESHNLKLITGSTSMKKVGSQSWEEYWRDERYAFLHGLKTPVVTAHHLDDVCEWWLFSSLHGKPALTPYSNQNVIRPFLTTPKSVLHAWCDRKGVPYVEDVSNDDTRYMRNFIRHNMMPHALHVNPGMRKVLAKKIMEENSVFFIKEAVAV